MNEYKLMGKHPNSYEAQIKWADESGYIENFPERRRSFITNLFCFAVRGRNWGNLDPVLATKDVDEVLLRVAAGCDERINNIGFFSSEMKADCIAVLESLPTARTFAQHVIDREFMEVGLKERLKTNAQKGYASKAMSAKEPSPAQLNYLKILGHRGDAPTTMAEAGTLITRLKEQI